MGVIMHENVVYGGGSVVEPNPAGTASTDLTKLGIDGVNYNVKDADAYHDGDLATVAETGSYSDLSNTPSIPTKTSDLTNDSGFVESSDLATVATSGSYNDLTNKPTIPAAQVNSDWEASSGVAQILHKPALATVATSGSYNDLSNKPTIPTVNDGTLTIQKNGTQVATFSANQSGNATANIECATPSDVEGSKVATGNPLTITDAAGIKAEKIEIGFEPQQDKHGYNSVWVGGAGKNKLPLSVAEIKSVNDAGTWSGNTYTINGGTLTIQTDSDGNFTGIRQSGTFSANTVFYFTKNRKILEIGTSYKFFVTSSPSGYGGVRISDNISYTYQSNNQFTLPSNFNQNTCSTFLYITSGSNYTATIYPMICLATETDNTFNPWENKASITGYTSLSADRCGKNLYDSSKVASQTLPNGNTRSSICFNKLNGTYTISRTTGENCYWGIWDGSSFSSNGNVAVNSSHSITITSNDVLWLWTDSGKNMSGINNLQVEKNPSATTYDPFKGDNITVQFGQTLYGGKLTILQDGSADVDVTDAYLDAGTKTWTSDGVSGRGQFRANLSDALYDENQVTVVCSAYQGTKATHYSAVQNNTVCISNAQSQPFLRIRDDRYVSATGTEFQTAMSGVQVVYKLYTPFTLHLSPVENLTLLQGINNVWTDGTTLSLTYQPDNAIGQAKGTAQDAMQMALDANVYTDTQLTNYALKSSVYKSAVSDSKSSWTAGEGWFADTIGPETKGVYVFIGWAEFDGSLGGRRGIKLARHNSSSTVMASAFTSESADSGYPRTVTCVEYVTCGTDAAVSLAWRRLRLYTANSLSSGTIKGGVIMIKISDL